MLERLPRLDLPPGGNVPQSKGTARGGEHQTSDLGMIAAVKCLMQRRVLGVDGKYLDSLRSGQGGEQRPGDHHRLFVGQGDADAGFECRVDRLEPHGTYHGSQHAVDAGGRRRLQQTGFARDHLDPSRSSTGELGSPLLIVDRHQRRTELAGLLLQLV